jgi:hypothetical protein
MVQTPFDSHKKLSKLEKKTALSFSCILADLMDGAVHLSTIKRQASHRSTKRMNICEKESYLLPSSRLVEAVGD